MMLFQPPHEAPQKHLHHLMMTMGLTMRTPVAEIVGSLDDPVDSTFDHTLSDLKHMNDTILQLWLINFRLSNYVS